MLFEALDLTPVPEYPKFMEDIALGQMPIMDFSVSSLIAGLVFGTIGLILFRQGKQRLHYTWVIIGLALMGYSLFTSGPWQDWGIGAALSITAYVRRP